MFMSAIRVLDDSVINRIAAGEVVERPSSVVKELVENSIDARARHIQIDIQYGGRKLIRIKDDGIGMSADDAFLALERHATSKLRTEKDLIDIATMGFRGEALASIASVSKLRLVTSDGLESGGTELVIEGGVFRKNGRIGVGKGTAIEVVNLFYNVPVRRKFLKSAQVESDHIKDLVGKFALAFPDISFKFSEDGKVKIDTAPVRDAFERIHSLFSKDVCANLSAVDFQGDRVKVYGYVARPPYARSSMRSVLTFVNKRSVRDKLINAAVNRAFTHLMERGRYPLAIIFVELPAEQVDVNVHPQKTEVRFREPFAVSDAVIKGIQDALMNSPFRSAQSERTPLAENMRREPQLTRREYGDIESNPQHAARADARLPNIQESGYSAANSTKDRPLRDSQAEVSLPARSTIELPSIDGIASKEDFSAMHILGKLPDSFVVLFDDDDLVIMDQHAAHERIIFEKLMKSEKEGIPAESQMLLIPKIVEFSGTEVGAMSSHLDLLRAAGFSIEEFGEKAFIVKGIPQWFHDGDINELFDNLVGIMLDSGIKGEPKRLKHELLKNMACKAAVKESSALNSPEIRAILRELDSLNCPLVCPHGRPFLIRMPFAEIRKKMGRGSAQRSKG